MSRDPVVDIEESRAYARLLALAEAGAPLSVRDLAALFRVGVSQMSKLDRAGALQAFKLTVPLGPKRFSGILVARDLKGQPMYVPTFGEKRKRSA